MFREPDGIYTLIGSFHRVINGCNTSNNYWHLSAQLLLESCNHAELEITFGRGLWGIFENALRHTVPVTLIDFDKLLFIAAFEDNTGNLTAKHLDDMFD